MPTPRWVKTLGWVNLAAAAMWMVAILTLATELSGGADRTSSTLFLVLFVPLLIAAQAPAYLVTIATALVVLAAVLVLRSRERMSRGRAVWAYGLLSWTIFWVILWAWTGLTLLAGLLS
jgi:uncharacterized membrane protein